MSVWGGEALGESMWKGIDTILKERAREQAQSNVDREYEFKQRQAEQAQANADRSYEASREDAANALANAEKDRALKSRALDASQANFEKTFKAGREDAANAQSNADRNYAAGREDAANAQANAEREFGLKDQEMAIKNEDLAIRKTAQEWENRLNAERERQFKLQNDQLAESWRKQQEENKLLESTGRNQFAHGVYSLMVNGDFYRESEVNIGNETMKAHVLPQKTRDELFGSEGPLSSIQSMFIVDTKDGKKIGFQMNTPSGLKTMLMSDEDAYNTLHDGVSARFADDAMRAYKTKRDMGLRIEEAGATAGATEKAKIDADPTGLRNIGGVFQSLLKAAADGTIVLDGETQRQLNAIASPILTSLDSALKKRTPGNGGGNGGNGGGEVTDPASLARAKAALEKKEKAHSVIPKKTTTNSAGSNNGGATSAPSANVEKVEPAKTEKAAEATDSRGLKIDETERKAIAEYKRMHPENAKDIDRNPAKYEDKIRSIARGMSGNKGYKTAGDRNQVVEAQKRHDAYMAKLMESGNDENVTKKVRAMYGSLYNKAKDMALENDEGDPKAVRKYFADLVDDYNSENGVVLDDFWHPDRRTFGDYHVGDLLSDVFGDDAGVYIGPQGAKGRAQRRLASHKNK